MFSGRLTHATIGVIDWIARKTLPPDNIPVHLHTGRRGEEECLFPSAKTGIRDGSPQLPFNRRGEIDLIGWHKDILCFVEVKTRTTRDGKPAEAAVDRYKRRELFAVAREYLRHLPPSCQWRFDVISVYYDGQSSQPQIELFRNISPWA